MTLKTLLFPFLFVGLWTLCLETPSPSFSTTPKASTTSEAPAACEDLLGTFAQKPEGLEFLYCKPVRSDQVLLRATYRTTGAQSKAVENFLVEHYDMGPLKWLCCGWESGAKYGTFESPALSAQYPDCSVLLYMYASGEVGTPEKPSGVTLTKNRKKIDYFTVVVELVVV